MKPKGLVKVSVATSSEAEEAVAELLGRVCGVQPSSFLDVESGQLTISVYLEDASRWSAEKRRAVRQGLDLTRKCGLDVGPGTIRASRLPTRNWAEAWKRHFRPLVIGRKLVVLPGWIKRKPVVGQQTVVLNPGLSFGTGHHPTTAFCLKEIVRVSAARAASHTVTSGKPCASIPSRYPQTGQKVPAGRKSFLDLGTGSGILAIAAVKLGFVPVDAVEIDPEAVRVAKANARQNGVQRRISFIHKDLRALKLRRYGLVCANLISDLLQFERDRIVGMVEPGGTLVLAGILVTEFTQVSRAYEAAGMVCVRSEVRREWCSGAFRAHF